MKKNLKNFHPLVQAIYILSLLSVFYFFFKSVSIYLSHPSFFQKESFHLFINFTLILGFSLDLLFLALWNIPFFFFFFFIIKTGKETYKKLAQYSLYIINIPIIWLSFLDSIFLKEKSYHFKAELLTTLKKEMLSEAGTLFLNYWQFTVFATFFTLLFIKIFNLKRVQLKKAPKAKVLQYSIGVSALLLYSLYFYSSYFIADHVPHFRKLVFSPISYRWITSQGTPYEKRFFKTKEEILKVLALKKNSSFKNSRKNQNIVLIVIESLSLDFVSGIKGGPSFFPFLHGLGKKGIFFQSHISPTASTSSALRFILYGWPSNVHQMPSHHKMINILNHLGYNTAFFFGDKKDTFSFDLMAKDLGFNKYYTKESYLESYPSGKDHLGEWGDVYERYFLNFAVKKINAMKRPFFALYLTNYPHIPYDFPNMKKGLGEKEKRIGNMKYIDSSLKDFFEKAEKEDWYKDTLFIITGDHTGQTFNDRPYRDSIEPINVPLILYHPSQNLKKYEKANKATSHFDINPSILDYAGYQKAHYFFGQSIFNDSFYGRALFFHREYVYVLEGDYFLTFHFVKHTSQLFKIEDRLMKNPLRNKNIKSYYDNLAKAYAQYVVNKLYIQ